ncbi:MAG: hypothetical protein FWE91_05700 [Defluviitaleaceae bacterium]|nr:hypothetical protein [Defluviitaleaceae bacterium]
MPKDEIKLEDFLLNVSPANLGFVHGTHDLLLTNGCTYKIETAKSGHVMSYLLPKTKKVIINYVFRKNSMIIRIYGDNIGKYTEILKTLPENMVKAIEKAPVCKRLVDPAKCNSQCPLGYVFDLNGKTYQNCRYNSFMFEVKEENFASIRDFVERELRERLVS